VPERVRLDDWDRAVDELRRFGEAGSVTVGDGRVRVDFGSAHVEVSQDGGVSTGMPLHGFEREGGVPPEGDVELVVDHEAGSLAIESGDVRYTFRRPGG